MKKILALTLAVTMLLAALAACGKKDTPASNDGGETEGTKGAISVISREDGSGTRGAFIELFGIEEKDADGNKVDKTIDAAEITNNTSVMLQSIAGDPSAIGYVSLGSLSNTVKALKIDTVAPSVETIKDGSYPISRPFNIATKDGASELALDFIAFILSTEGQDIVEEKGYIRVEDSGAYAGTKPAGKITVAGSSSVSPVMEALMEAYIAINPSAEIVLQQNDSTTGMNSVMDGICDIGMASRELKDSETAAGLAPTVIALDGIAVVVNPDNSVDGLTRAEVKGIYTGSLVDWSEVN